MRNLQRGVTFLELMVALVIAGILATFAIATFGGPGIDCKDKNSKGLAHISYTERARVAAAKGEIGAIFLKVDMFDLNHNRPQSILPKWA